MLITSGFLVRVQMGALDIFLAWTTSGELGWPAKPSVPFGVFVSDTSHAAIGLDNQGRLGVASKANRPARDSERNGVSPP